MFRFVSQVVSARFSKTIAASVGTLLATGVVVGSAFAAKPAPKAAPPTAAAPSAMGRVSAGKDLAGIAPVDVKVGNGPVAEIKKKRGEAPTVAPSKDAIVAWFTALNVKHTADEQGRIIVPYRDEASSINFNIIIIPQMKPSSGNVWAIRAVVPLALPLPEGDSGLARALIFANNWNNDHFLNKVGLMQPADRPFFLLDATIVCEAGLNQADFINNFLVLLVQDSIGFAKKGLAELK